MLSFPIQVWTSGSRIVVTMLFDRSAVAFFSYVPAYQISFHWIYMMSSSLVELEFFRLKF